MCERLVRGVVLGLVLCSAGRAADVDWTGSAGDRLWDNPGNWSTNTVPAASDVAFVDVPAALAPNGPVIQSGVEARINGLVCEVTGRPTMTMTGGTLDISQYIWWGDGPDCFGTFYLSGGTLTTGAEFELGWGGGGGTLYMTGGTVNAQELVIPTATGAEGTLYLYGGTVNVGDDGLSMSPVGLIDIGAGTLILEGDHAGQINDLIAGGRIIAYSGDGHIRLDYNVRNPGKTTVTAEGTRRASGPQPVNNAVDVPRDVVLNWTPGVFTSPSDGHIVYFGDSFDDVNDATDGVAQDTNSYAPDQRLEFDKTYYWRVDEVRAAPDSAVYRGDVWQFTTEPYAYPLENIHATASGAMPGMGPEKTIDGSGLNAMDQHSTEAPDMWLASSADSWIQYEFDKAYLLHEMQVWNSNQVVEAFIGFGVKDLILETSLDGETWTRIEGVAAFAQATGLPTYTANTTVDLSGMMARYVRITPQSTYGETGQCGLSEVRFLYIPVHAREPLPADKTTTDGLDVVLQWRAGREAASHEVYFGTDRTAVADGTALAGTTDTPRFDLGSQEIALNTTYYWKITEVNESAARPSYEGDIWSFTTPDYVAVDNFDQYDDFCRRIFFTWLDGLGHNGAEECGIEPYEGNHTGSAVGNAEPSFAETTVVVSGQSMPLAYDNSQAPYYSEAVSGDYALPEDWTQGGAQVLSLWFRGVPGTADQPGNAPEPFYLRVTDGSSHSKRMEHPDPDAALAGEWREWQIPFGEFDELDLTRVKNVALGLGNPDNPQQGGAGTLYIDEIRVGQPLFGDAID